MEENNVESLFKDNGEELNANGLLLQEEVQTFLVDLFEKWDEFPTRQVESILTGLVACVAIDARADGQYNLQFQEKYLQQLKEAAEQAEKKAAEEALNPTDETTEDVSKTIATPPPVACCGCSDCGSCDEDCDDEGKSSKPFVGGLFMNLDDVDKIKEMFAAPPVPKSGAVIDSFSGEYEFLRNDFRCEQNSTYFYNSVDGNNDSVILQKNVNFKSAEHAFQANKTLDDDAVKLIIQAPDARTAVSLGRQAKLIDNWTDDKRLEVMERVLTDKFTQNLEPKIRLIQTGDAELIMGDSRDTFWGVNRDGVGENNLGNLLMKIREKILRDEGSAKDILTDIITRCDLAFILPWITFPPVGVKI